MNLLRTASLSATALALLALPAAAGAVYVVPSGNSAVNQYTETVPTAGGGQDAGKGNKKPVKRSPSHVLGARNAQRLHAHGPDGQAAAETAAATAPTPVETSAATQPSGGGADSAGSGEKAHAEQPQAGLAPARPVDGASQQTSPDTRGAPTELPSGSSGIGETISWATGSTSSGQTGALLPLVLLAAIAWAAAFFWRQRRQLG